MHRIVTALQTFSPYQSRHGLYSTEVPVPGRAGAPDHLPGAHHEILPDPAGWRSTLPRLLSCGVGWAPEDPCLCAACSQGAQWVPDWLKFYFLMSADQKLAGLPAINLALLIKFVQLGITVKEHWFLAVLWSGVASFTITARQMKQIKGPVLSLNGRFAAVWLIKSEAHAKKKKQIFVKKKNRGSFDMQCAISRINFVYIGHICSFIHQITACEPLTASYVRKSSTNP